MLFVNLLILVVQYICVVHCKRNNVTTCVSLLSRVVSTCVGLYKTGPLPPVLPCVDLGCYIPHVYLLIQFGPLPSVSRCVRGQSVEACTGGDSPGQLPALPVSSHRARCY